MKTKKTTKSNQKSRIIFFFVLSTYNLLLGVYQKDFLVISPMLVTLYLLSAYNASARSVYPSKNTLRALVF